jgi:hypothetical protein
MPRHEPGDRRYRAGDRAHSHGERMHRHGGGRGRARGFGRPGGWQQADLPSADDTAAWFTGRLPDGWFTGAPAVTVDREEIVVMGELPAPESAPSQKKSRAAAAGSGSEDDAQGPDDDSTHHKHAAASAREAAAVGRISRFREDTRDERMIIADEAEARYGRKVAWGASIGDTRVLFTHLAVPVMTRLRQDERRVLDTLVDAGVARSRSDALAWCVTLVGEHTEQWLSGLREAMSEVDKLRAEGPDL